MRSGGSLQRPSQDQCRPDWGASVHRPGRAQIMAYHVGLKHADAPIVLTLRRLHLDDLARQAGHISQRALDLRDLHLHASQRIAATARLSTMTRTDNTLVIRPCTVAPSSSRAIGLSVAWGASRTRRGEKVAGVRWGERSRPCGTVGRPTCSSTIPRACRTTKNPGHCWSGFGMVATLSSYTIAP